MAVNGNAGTMYEMNTIVRLKKPHPCGGTEWEIVRAGADIKLRCRICGRYVNLSRGELEKRRAPEKKEMR